MFRPLLILSVSALLVGQAWGDPAQKEASGENRPNFLFIIVDDLRPEMGCYGVDLAHTPEIDRLAEEATLFENAFCMVPTCGASRASLFSGVRPAPRRFVNFRARADRGAPWAGTLNTTLKDAGYHTVSLGKVFHDPDDNIEGWSEAPWRGNLPRHALEESRIVEEGKRYGVAFEQADVEDSVYPDGELAERAMASLKELKGQADPFFLAVGFWKPHLPFCAPKKYWDLFERSDFELPDNYRPPFDFPEFAVHDWGELRAYSGIPDEGPVSDETAISLIHAYYACVSYIDAQIGKLLEELDRLGLEKDTVVILTGDHGWNLGEHSMWSKHTCFETAMQVPLIIKVPGNRAGRRAPGMVELFELYPTICDLAGVSTPETVEAESFLSLLEDPEKSWSDDAIGRYGRGDTIRTAAYRYTEYREGDGTPITRMLFDHRVDPDENHNLAEKPEMADEVSRLSARLNAGMGQDRESE